MWKALVRGRLQRVGAEASPSRLLERAQIPVSAMQSAATIPVLEREAAPVAAVNADLQLIGEFLKAMQCLEVSPSPQPLYVQRPRHRPADCSYGFIERYDIALSGWPIASVAAPWNAFYSNKFDCDRAYVVGSLRKARRPTFVLLVGVNGQLYDTAHQDVPLPATRLFVRKPSFVARSLALPFSLHGNRYGASLEDLLEKRVSSGCWSNQLYLDWHSDPP